MPNAMSAADAVLQYEGGQTPAPASALADVGDHQTFGSADTLWSAIQTAEPRVLPDGLISGGAVVPAAATNQVDVAACSVYLAGVKVNVSAAAGKSISRGTAGTPAKISSVTVDSGGAVTVVAGTEGASFSETRGAAGGPPLIPVGSVELGQVRTLGTAAAAVLISEIYQVVGVHQERFDFPLYDVNHGKGQVRFTAPLPLIHVGGLPKKVFASYAKPIFTEIPLASAFVPPEESHSTSSETVYGGAVGSVSKSLGQGSFTAKLASGVRDAVVKLKGKRLWFRFFPNRYSPDYIQANGILGIQREFPADGNINAKCTISATEAAVEVEG